MLWKKLFCRAPDTLQSITFTQILMQTFITSSFTSPCQYNFNEGYWLCVEIPNSVSYRLFSVDFSVLFVIPLHDFLSALKRNENHMSRELITKIWPPKNAQSQYMYSMRICFLQCQTNIGTNSFRSIVHGGCTGVTVRSRFLKKALS